MGFDSFCDIDGVSSVLLEVEETVFVSSCFALEDIIEDLGVMSFFLDIIFLDF